MKMLWVPLVATMAVTVAHPSPAVAASMDDNLRTATLTILASRNCKGVNHAKVKRIIRSAIADAERHGVSGGDFMGEVSLKVADLSSWFKRTKGACKDFGFLVK